MLDLRHPSSNFWFIVTTAAIQARREYGNDLQPTLGQIFLEGRVLALVEDDHSHLFGLADGKHQFGTQAQQPVLVGDDQAANTPFDHFIEQALQVFLAESMPEPRLAMTSKLQP